MKRRPIWSGDTSQVPVFRRRPGERDELSGTALSEADRVWNRAAMERGGTQPRKGDVALAALLSLHSLAMNGGLLHAIERHSHDEIEQAVSGFRYFDLNDAAEVVVSIAQQAGRVDVADLDAVEQLASKHRFHSGSGELNLGEAGLGR